MSYKEHESKKAYSISPYDLVLIAGLVYQPMKRTISSDGSKITFDLTLHSVGYDYGHETPFDILLTLPIEARMDTVMRSD